MGAACRVGRRPGRGFAVCLAALLLAGGATACSDGEGGRRFANEPLPSIAPPTASATIDPADRPTEPAGVGGMEGEQSAGFAGDLLDARGAPKRIFFLAGGELWGVGADGADPRRVYAPSPHAAIRAVAPSPGVAADAVAILVAAPVDPAATPVDPAATPASSGGAAPAANGEVTETASLVILDAGGGEIRRIDALESALASTSPGTAPRADALSWSPQGDVLLASFAPGGVVAVPLDGDPYALVVSAMAPHTAWVSPAGDAVAFLADEPETGQSWLYLADVDPDGVASPVPIGPDPALATGIARAAWLPDGSGLLYAEIRPGGFAGGDLYRVSRDGGERELVASAGRAAPVARVVDFAIAPDGRAVAYTIAIPDMAGTGLLFHSLWVQDLGSARSFQVPTAPSQTVAELWWTDGGLVWRGETEPDSAATGGAFTLERLDRSGSTAVIFAYSPPAATPAASPAATPAASPAASPVASPIASPVASPAASPAASPEGSPAAGATPVARLLR
jgi:hypothetical protein